MMKSESRYALIIAGGSGTRLWPMSRKHRPKQLIPFIDGKSLIEISFDRLHGLIPAERRFICASNAHRDAIFHRVHDLAPSNFLGEPVGRDTLPAIAYSMSAIAAIDPNAVVAVLTADHIITPEPKFREILEAGFELAEERHDRLCTFGITPDRPATSFGYLELGSAVGKTNNELTARRVARFKEKPDSDTAGSYVASGPDRYLWNSGMFVWRAATFLRCVSTLEPELNERIGRITSARTQMGPESAEFGEFLAESYPELKKISVDFAIMEPASVSDSVEVVALPMNLSWRDIGSWPAFGGTIEPDASKNEAFGRSILRDSTGCLVVNEDDGHVVASLGIDDLVIVHTANATLVCRRDRAEDIKSLHAEIRERFGDDYI